MAHGQKSDFQDGDRRHLKSLKKLIFGQVTAIGFNICSSVPYFIEIGQFFTDIMAI